MIERNDMKDRVFEQVAAIARRTSDEGGLSLHDALIEARYRELRPQLKVAALAKWLDHHPAVVNDWLLFSDDKRTPGGYYLLSPERGGWVVGSIGGPERRFKTPSIAAAFYILTELDFWASLP